MRERSRTSPGRPIERIGRALFLATFAGACAPTLGMVVASTSRVHELDGVRVLYDCASDGPPGHHAPRDETDLDALVDSLGLNPVEPQVD